MEHAEHFVGEGLADLGHGGEIQHYGAEALEAQGQVFRLGAGHQQAGPATAEAVGARIVDQIVKLTDFPERIRASERVPGTRELVIARLPHIAFVRVLPDVVQVLNIVHTARKFPG